MGTYRTRHGVLYYSGGDDAKHKDGVVIMISAEMEKSVVDCIPFGERVIFLKLSTTHRVTNVIQVHAPTSDKSDDEIEEF